MFNVGLNVGLLVFFESRSGEVVYRQRKPLQARAGNIMISSFKVY
ncbi:hypothetical protein ES708_30765 [subsurface metagenome]